VASLHQVRVSADIAAPPKAVWARVSDHGATPSWVKAVKRVTLARNGEPAPNGKGAIRVVEFKPKLWNTIHEEITKFDPDRAFEYVLFKGMPGLKAHKGRVSVEEIAPGQSRLTWDVEFRFRRLHPFAPFIPRFLKDFEAVLSGAVTTLKTQMETAPKRRGPLRRLTGMLGPPRRRTAPRP
jgi:hypothetical protein